MWLAFEPGAVWATMTRFLVKLYNIIRHLFSYYTEMGRGCLLVFSKLSVLIFREGWRDRFHLEGFVMRCSSSKEWRKLQVLKSSAAMAACLDPCRVESTRQYDELKYWPIVRALRAGISAEKIGIDLECLEEERKKYRLRHARQSVRWFFKEQSICNAGLEMAVSEAIEVGCTYQEIGVTAEEVSAAERIHLLRLATQAVSFCRSGWAHFYGSIDSIQRAVEFGIPYSEFGTSETEFESFVKQRDDERASRKGS